MKKLFVIIGLFIMSSMFLANCGNSEGNKSADNKFLIGVSISGIDDKVYTDAIEKSINLAKKEINNKGGLLGRKIDFIIKYTQSNVENARLIAREFIDLDKVNAIIGGNTSSEFLAIGEEMVKPGGVPVISHAATADSISDFEDNNLLWRTVPKDGFQAKVAAEYAISEKKMTSVILFVDNTYGQNLAEKFESIYKNLGGSVLAKASFPYQQGYTDYDFMQHLQPLMAKKPQMLYLISYQQDGIAVLTALENNRNELNAENLFILGCDGNRNESISDYDFAVFDNMAFVAPGKNRSPGSNYEKFISNYEKEYNLKNGEYYSQYIANVYDSVYLIAYAVLAAGKVDSASIAGSLQKISREGEIVNINEFSKGVELISKGTDIDYDGASGKIEFDANGDISSALYEISKINRKEKAFEVVKSVEITESIE